MNRKRVIAICCLVLVVLGVMAFGWIKALRQLPGPLNAGDAVDLIANGFVFARSFFMSPVGILIAIGLIAWVISAKGEKPPPVP